MYYYYYCILLLLEVVPVAVVVVVVLAVIFRFIFYMCDTDRMLLVFRFYCNFIAFVHSDVRVT